MQILPFILADPRITLANLAFRLLLSFLLGGMIGFEREYHKQPAGLRTHMLICVGACLLMSLSLYLPQALDRSIDPGRLAGQVVSGIGFLGAGAILRLGVNVRGLTTAASLWVVAGVGLAAGAGMYAGALLGALLILFTLAGLNPIEQRLFPTRNSRALNVRLRSGSLGLERILPLLRRHGIEIRTVGITQSVPEGRVEISLLVQIPTSLDLEALYMDLRTVEGIEQIRIGHNI